MEKILKVYGDRLTVESAVEKFNSLRDRFEGTGVTPENISVVLLALMMEVNNFKMLTGSEKKTLVTKLLTHIVTEIGTTDEQPALRQIIEMTVPTLIDNFVEVSKGAWVFRNIKNKFFCC